MLNLNNTEPRTMISPSHAVRKTTFGDISDFHPSEGRDPHSSKLHSIDENDPLQINLHRGIGHELVLPPLKVEKEYEFIDNESKMLKVSRHSVPTFRKQVFIFIIGCSRS